MNTMKPHDATDLLLAPVALALDARIEELGRLDAAKLAEVVILETNAITRSRAEAAQALVDAITYLIDTHGWAVSWDERGVRLAHSGHEIVLGVPAGLTAYVDTCGRTAS